jgi:hypothetical protein
VKLVKGGDVGGRAAVFNTPLLPEIMVDTLKVDLGVRGQAP